MRKLIYGDTSSKDLWINLYKVNADCCGPATINTPTISWIYTDFESYLIGQVNNFLIELSIKSSSKFTIHLQVSNSKENWCKGHLKYINQKSIFIKCNHIKFSDKIYLRYKLIPKYTSEFSFEYIRLNIDYTNTINITTNKLPYKKEILQTALKIEKRFNIKIHLIKLVGSYLHDLHQDWSDYDIIYVYSGKPSAKHQVESIVGNDVITFSGTPIHIWDNILSIPNFWHWENYRTPITYKDDGAVGLKDFYQLTTIQDQLSDIADYTSKFRDTNETVMSWKMITRATTLSLKYKWISVHQKYDYPLNVYDLLESLKYEVPYDSIVNLLNNPTQDKIKIDIILKEFAINVMK